MKKNKRPAPEQYLRDNMRKAERALKAVPKEERDISAVTVSLSGEAAERVRWELRDLRGRILDLARKDACHEAVYQVNLQFFPVSE